MKRLEITTATLEQIKIDFNRGMPIAIPTDTNYNFICDPFNEAAIHQVFNYKKRSFDKPLSLFFYKKTEIFKYAKNYDHMIVNNIIDTFLPGPLNIILNKNTDAFDKILNGNDSIAFGSIKNKNWRTVIKFLNQPVAMTSANISGTADGILVSEEMLKNQMSETLSYYIAGMTSNNNKSSTIIKIQNQKIILIREGDILFSDIIDHLSDEDIFYEL